MVLLNIFFLVIDFSFQTFAIVEKTERLYFEDVTYIGEYSFAD